ncbi:MAG: S1 RNA-binding domain-containing protein [Archangium sp.]|nr:S1 RNA-binding domain-containing protein [Archangium sp.]
MLGIPSGQGGERREKPARGDAPRREERKTGGPMVVVKRAGGAIETRKPEPTPVAPTGDTNGHAAAAPVTPVVRQGPSVSDEVSEQESFAEMFEKHAKDGGLPTRKLPKVGEKVRAKIFQLGAENVFVTIGKLEAMIELDELKDDEGILRFGVGDEVEAFVIETGAKGIALSRKMSKGAASLSMLSDARLSGMPIEGLVIAVNKGGVEVAVGDIRAFCPTSQLDVRPVAKPDELVGQRLTFRVTEVRDRNVVLSRRSLIEEELKGKAVELRKTLEVGKIIRGRVVNVQAFGAFVDLGGLEGLIPVSEISHVRVQHPSDVVKVGDEVEVEIIRLEAAEPNSPDKSKRKERITLSMRKLMEDPFTAALPKLAEGAQLKGKVVRLQPFGAFIELFPGVDGLIHVSAMSDRRIAHPRDVLRVGDEVEVKIEKIDTDEKRVALRLVKDGVAVGDGVATSSAPAATEGAPAEKAAKPAAAPRPKRGAIITGKVVRIESYGIFVEFDGHTGLVPGSETGTDRGTDLKRVFPMGHEVKAEVIELEGSKIKLSITAASKTEERADLEAWKAQQAKSTKSSGGFNSLADKLKGLKLQ